MPPEQRNLTRPDENGTRFGHGVAAPFGPEFSRKVLDTGTMHLASTKNLLNFGSSGVVLFFPRRCVDRQPGRGRFSVQSAFFRAALFLGVVQRLSCGRN